MNYKIDVSENINELAIKLAGILTELLAGSANKINIALSGGSTPEAVFDFLSNNFKDKIDWNRINFYWGDERCVPSDHPDSNYFMSKEHLFDNIELNPENIFVINGDNNPEDEAQRYSELIKKNVIKVNGIPSFDLTILGLGEDGHTASIFPDSLNLINDIRICAVSQHPALCQKRITITGTVINNSRKIVFLVTGSKKSGVVDIIINKKDGFQNLPAAHIKTNAGELVWLIDKDAASRL